MRQLAFHDFNGAAHVGAVVCIENIAAGGYEDELRRRAAAVDSEPGVPRVGSGVFFGNGVPGMAAYEFVVLSCVSEERPEIIRRDVL
ncbi:hypothetical protein SDC9_211229 [bioreactor metagenome]|uniref:Uncharacterized protein n=1 Tax=bioreactor metagenome TaxID=1076179 RepID=A0A645JK21_9ZZZZ